MSDSLLHVNDENFQSEVLDSDVPTLVDFWAPWCAPCNIIAPVIEELAEEYKGKLRIAKMNVDESPATPGQYGIRGIPTVILFKGGKVADQVVGVVPKAHLKAMIDKVVS
jgi:thioredoxin 1